MHKIAIPQAAIDRAADIGALVSAAVVDQGGHLVHFQRMDKAELAGPTLAVDKAFTSVAHRIATAELGPLTQPGADLWGLQANGGGRYVVFGGGIIPEEDIPVLEEMGVRKVFTPGAATTEITGWVAEEFSPSAAG